MDPGWHGVWESFDPAWRECLDLAWEARSAGSVPVGAVIVNPSNVVVARGRNRIGERIGPLVGIAGTPMAHAEVNAFLALPRGMVLADHSSGHLASLAAVPERLDGGSGKFGCLKVQCCRHTHCGCEAAPRQEAVSITTTTLPRRDQQPLG